MTPYRVAIVGAGGMGKTHARHWKNLDGVEIVGAMDVDKTAAQSVSAAAFDDWDALLRNTKPDIIDICTPTPMHCNYIERAAAAGKAIFVEKPLGRTLEECDTAVAAVEKADVPLMAGHVVRWFPEFAAAKKLLDAGGVGMPAAIRTSRTSGIPGAGRPVNWFEDEAQSGGVALDFVIHDFDWLRWCFGDVTRVFAKGWRDYALVTLRFQSGAMAHITGSWLHADGFRTTFEIAGDTGLIEHDSRQTPSVMASRPESPLALSDDPYFLELAAFLQSLRDGVPPPVTVHEAREAARIAFAALDSMATGKAVTL